MTTDAAPTILVVDDEALIALELEDLLQAAGYRVAGPAMDVAEGLALIETGPVDGAILDVDLAGERSDPLAARLTDLGIPFVLLTGHAVAAVDASRRPAAIVAKPFDHRGLRRALAEMLPDGAGGGRR